MLNEVLTMVVSPFVQAVTLEFLTKRRPGVELAELKEEVIRLAADQGRIAEDMAAAHRAVLVLVKVLASRDLFSVRDDLLVLTDGKPDLEDLTFLRHLDEFEARVAALVKQRAARTQPPSPGSQIVEQPPEVPMDVALSRFFEGFDDELRQERLSFKAKKVEGQ